MRVTDFYESNSFLSTYFSYAGIVGFTKYGHIPIYYFPVHVNAIDIFGLSSARMLDESLFIHIRIQLLDSRI